MRSSRATNALAALRFRGLPPARFRHGFSLIETMVASVLAAFLGILLALSCALFGRSAVEVESVLGSLRRESSQPSPWPATWADSWPTRQAALVP